MRNGRLASAAMALAMLCGAGAGCARLYSGGTALTKTGIPEGEVWVHPACTPLPLDTRGPYVELSDGSLWVADGNSTRVSTDDGRTWSDPEPIVDPNATEGVPGQSVTVRTKDGTLVMVYVDTATMKSTWDYEAIRASEDTRSDVWVARSTDDGKTWSDGRKIFDGYCGYLVDIIQTSTGDIVVPVQGLAPERTRHVQRTFVSADDGLTWTRSNAIDLGGRGDHDGAFEATLAELRDGRLLMLIRTSLDAFWKAYSDDGGRYWRVIRPSGIDASNSPGHLVRLHSGRLVLVWNRLYMEGKDSVRRTDEYWTFVSERGCSWMRAQLSIAFSDDDGETWSTPVVILQNPETVSYASVFERRPGELWITTGPAVHGGIAVMFHEADFISN